MSVQWRVEQYRGRWAAVRGHGNSKQRRSLGALDRERAEAAVRRLNSELAAAKKTGPARVDDILGHYIEDRRASGTVNMTRIEEVRKSLKPVWGHLYPEELDKQTCKAFVERGRRKKLSDATIRQEMAYLQAALNFAAVAKLIPATVKLDKPPPPRPREQWLTREDARKLLDACDAFHAQLFVVLAISTAGRPKHLMELTWERVDLAQRVINLDNPEADRTRKGRARVPINDLAHDYLSRAIEAAQSRFVIEWDGKPVKSVKTAIRAAVRRSGLKDVTPYVLRHTAGVWMAQAGVPLAEIAEYMGHTSMETTRRVYAKFHPDHLRKASNALEM